MVNCHLNQRRKPRFKFTRSRAYVRITVLYAGKNLRSVGFSFSFTTSLNNKREVFSRPVLVPESVQKLMVVRWSDIWRRQEVFAEKFFSLLLAACKVYRTVWSSNSPHAKAKIKFTWEPAPLGIVTELAMIVTNSRSRSGDWAALLTIG